jgi:hypothetical protein
MKSGFCPSRHLNSSLRKTESHLGSITITLAYSKRQETHIWMKIQSAWSSALAPSTKLGPDENMPPVSTLGTFQNPSCHHFTHHSDEIISSFWVVERCSTGVEAWSECVGVATEPRKTGTTQSPVSPSFPTGERCRLLHGSTTAFMFV